MSEGLKSNKPMAINEEYELVSRARVHDSKEEEREMKPERGLIAMSWRHLMLA